MQKNENIKSSITPDVLSEKGISSCRYFIRVIGQQLPKIILFTALLGCSVPSYSLAESMSLPPGEHATQPVSQWFIDSEFIGFGVIARLNQVTPQILNFTIPFIPVVSAESESVSDNHAQQEGECTYQYGCIVLDHWFVLFNLILVVSGALISPWVFKYDRHLKWPDFPRINPPESDYHPKTQEGPKKRPGEL